MWMLTFLVTCTHVRCIRHRMFLVRHGVGWGGGCMLMFPCTCTDMFDATP